MNQSICPQCQSPIPPDAPAGLCPTCILLAAAGPTMMAGAATAAGSLPSLPEMRAAFPELEIFEAVGQGGMGIVFKVRQTRLDRLAALKILPPLLAVRPGFAERFLREARALARLSHPHIVAVYDFGERMGFYYLVMEYVDGVNLRQAIRAGVKPEQALLLVPKVCEALQFAHDRGVLHRDIKPENILLDVQGVPKLADFGIAKFAGEGVATGLTMTGASLGTAAYMAPEQVEHPSEVDHRADIYSLGVVLYEMLTGELPLGRFAPPSEKSRVNRGVDEVVLRALEKERERRQQSAKEMKTEVEHLSSSGLGRDSGFAARGPERGAPDRDFYRQEENPAHGGGGGFAPVFLILMIVSALLIPMHSVIQVPAMTFIMMTAVFAVLFGVWPRGSLRGSRGRWPRPDQWGLRCLTCGQANLADPAWVIRLGAYPMGQRVTTFCRTCGTDRAQVLEPAGRRTTPRQRRSHESRSSATLFGLPLYHVVRGPDPETGEIPVAVGVVAVGPMARGLLAIGGRSFGGIAIGGAAFGLFALGGLSFGIVAVGGVAVALLGALGGCAIAPLAVGGMAIGLSATGGFAVGKEALRGGMLGRTESLGELALNLRRVVIFTVAGLGLSAFIVALLGLFASRRQRDPYEPVNPWPRRLVWLIAAFVLIPTALFTVGIVVPRWQMNRRPASLVRSYDEFRPVDVVAGHTLPAVAQWARGKVELVAVTRHPEGISRWWSMNGGAVAEGPFVTTPRLEPRPGETAYQFVFRTSEIPQDASSLEWVVEGATRTTGGGTPALAKSPDQPLPGYTVVVASVSDTLDYTGIKLGLATEPWTNVTSSRPGNAIVEHGMAGGLRWEVTHGPAIETKDGIATTFQFTSRPGWEERVVPVNTQGEVLGRGSLTRLNNVSTYVFAGVKKTEVAELRFQVRPLRWVEFEQVSLRPMAAPRPSVQVMANGALERGGPIEREEAALAAARTRLRVAKDRHEAGIGSVLELAEAERDFAVAEAGDNPGLVMKARLRYAREKARIIRERVEVGLSPSADREQAEAELKEAEQAASDLGIPQ